MIDNDPVLRRKMRQSYAMLAMLVLFLVYVTYKVLGPMSAVYKALTQ